MAGDAAFRDCVISPSPEDPSVLRLQDVHISESLWAGNERPALVTRKAGKSFAGNNIHPELVQPLSAAGLLGVAQLQAMEVDHSLITTLVERWRPETHTFHMLPGECTITLQDVAVQLGLRIDGRPVIGSTSGNKFDIVENTFGIRPPATAFNGNHLRMTWLDQQFARAEDHLHPPEQFQRYVRAYIARLIGGFMLSDHSGGLVSLRYIPLLNNLEDLGQYSWGSATLAHLYRELCKATDPTRHEIGGLTLLIQLWAWERFPCISPRPSAYDPQTQRPYASRWDRRVVSQRGRDLQFYRYKFDRMERDEICWMPYSEDLLSQLPGICIEGRELWRSRIPLICFHVVEWHQPDRVMRQFGMRQHIPEEPLQPENLHDITLRGKTDQNWEQLLALVLEIWDSRFNWVVPGVAQEGLLSSNSEYMRWYWRITRRWITRDGAVSGRMHDFHERWYYLTTSEGYSSSSRHELNEMAIACLTLDHEQNRMLEPASPAAVPPQHGPQRVQIDFPPRRREGRGLRRHRTTVEPNQYMLPLPSLSDRGMGEYPVPPSYPFYPTQASSATYHYPSQPFYSSAGASSSHPPAEDFFPDPPPYIPDPPPYIFDPLSYISDPTHGVPPSLTHLMTPPAYGTSLLTPPAPSPPVFHDAPHMTQGFDLRNVDLNSVFDDVDDTNPGGNEDHLPERRNPRRAARDRPRPCVLSEERHRHRHRHGEE